MGRLQSLNTEIVWDAPLGPQVSIWLCDRIGLAEVNAPAPCRYVGVLTV